MSTPKLFQGLTMGTTVPAAYSRAAAVDIAPGLPNAVLQTNSGGTANTMNAAPNFTSLSVGGNALPVTSYAGEAQISIVSTDVWYTGVTTTLHIWRTGNQITAFVPAFTIPSGAMIADGALYVDIPANFRAAVNPPIFNSAGFGTVNSVDSVFRVSVTGTASIPSAQHRIRWMHQDGDSFLSGDEVEWDGGTISWCNSSVV